MDPQMGYLGFRNYFAVDFNDIMIYQILWDTAQREIYSTKIEDICSSKGDTYENENAGHRMGDNICKTYI